MNGAGLHMQAGRSICNRLQSHRQKGKFLINHTLNITDWRRIAGVPLIMSSEATGETVTVKTEGAAAPATAPTTAPAPPKGEWKCPFSDQHVHREDVGKVWKECQEESFWYRALPISLGSMAVTGGFIYNGVWKSSPRFGPFPKLAVAGILGYAFGKASYMGTCWSKFQELGVGPGPGPGPWGNDPRSRIGPWGGSGHGHRPCNHVCKECQKMAPAAPAAPAEQQQS